NPAYRPPGTFPAWLLLNLGPMPPVSHAASSSRLRGNSRALRRESVGNDRAAFAPRRLDVAPRGPCQSAHGEPAGHGRAGVDANAVATVLRHVGDRVSMDHDYAMRALVRQERLTYPPKVAAALLVYRDARIYAGVNEQIVADPDHILEAFEERDVVDGHG